MLGRGWAKRRATTINFTSFLGWRRPTQIESHPTTNLSMHINRFYQIQKDSLQRDSLYREIICLCVSIDFSRYRKIRSWDTMLLKDFSQSCQKTPRLEVG